MATLRELGAFFFRYKASTLHCGRPQPDGSVLWGDWPCDSSERVETLAEAQGVWFDCPLCYGQGIAAGKAPGAGVHGVRVFFAGRGVPDVGVKGDVLGANKEGRPVRWQVVGGTGLDDLQLSPSVLLESGCGWHGFVGSSGVPPGCAK